MCFFVFHVKAQARRVYESIGRKVGKLVRYLT